MVRAGEEGVRDQGKAAEVEKLRGFRVCSGAFATISAVTVTRPGGPASSARGVGPHLLALRYFFLATDTSAGLS